MYKVVEIFSSIDGEGCRAGRLAQFIRLAGCNLQCTYCDTRYAWQGLVEYREMTAADILDTLRRDIPNITLTGGEPLLSVGAKKLITSLIDNGYSVNVETNGAVPVEQFRVTESEKLIFTVDYKLPSSGMERFMAMENFFSLKEHDVVKFVVGSETDMTRLTEIVSEMQTHCRRLPQIYIGAVWGRYEPSRIVERMLHEPTLNQAILQLQMHKFIWNPTRRGV